MIKKILLLITMGVFAYGGPFDIKDNFINTTASSKWSDPGTGVTYYSGPNLEYRFDPVGNSTVPWLQFQLPSAKIGCNGLSIKGGFMALLGLKDIKIQLTNAGPTFAWGVLTTIEISMPSVAAVFQKIQKWVRAIQNLLQNACQSGQQAGEWMKKKYGLGKFEGGIVNDGADKIKGWLDSVEDKLDEINKIGDDDHNDTKKALTSEQIQRIGSGVSFLSMSFGRMLGKCSLSELGDKQKVDFTAKDIYDGTVESCDLSSKDTAFDQKKKSYILSRLLFGELVVTPESISPIIEKFNADGKFSKESAQKDLKAVVARSEFPLGVFEYSLLPPVIADARKAALYLINGSETQYNIPNTKAVYIKYKSSDASKEGMVTDENGSIAGSVPIFSVKDASGNPYSLYEIRAIYTTRASDGTSIVPVKWDGLVKESKQNILKYIENALTVKVGSVSVSNYFGDIPVPTVSLATVKTPLLVSGMSGYLNTITQAALEKGGVFAVMPLIDLLAQYNAQLFAEQLLSEIKKQVEKAESGANLITNEHSNKGFADFRKRTQLLYNEMQKQIRSMKKETVNDIQKVPEMFEKLEKTIRTKRINKTR